MQKLTAFDWDSGNENKNYLKHRITKEEAEEPFFDKKAIKLNDHKHSFGEARFILVGKTKRDNVLSIVYTLRNSFIRIISARSASKKEKEIYEKKTNITKI